MTRILSIVLNLVIFSATLVIILRYFRKDGAWRAERGRKAFRYFTCLSNVFCAGAALLMVLCQIMGNVPGFILRIKYVSTVTVTVTLMTVLLFLGPSVGYRKLMEKENLYMHLIGPVLAILSFCFFEKRDMSVSDAMWGLAPVILYGIYYLYRTRYAPEDKRWEDFYGFNRGRMWPVCYAAMVAGTILICLALRAI